MVTRVLGIVHRRKKTKEEEERPTKVAIQAGTKIQTHDLKTETDELDFLLARFPTAYRKVTNHREDLTVFQAHHLKWRRLAETEQPDEFADAHIRFHKKKGQKVYEVVGQVPSTFDGLATGDAVAMLLGGSGDRLAAALSRRGEEIGARVFRIPANILVQLRGAASKDDNYLALARELASKLASGVKDMRPFYELRRRDRCLIRLKEVLKLRERAMINRIACDQQIQQAAIGKIFLSEEGRYPEGLIEDIYNQEKASDAILAGLLAEEDRRMADLEQAVRATPIWPLFDAIEGCGTAIGARLIAAIGDIRRFWVDPDLVAMQASYAESGRLERLGKFTEDKDKVAGRIKHGMRQFQILQLVRSWKRANGKGNEAVYLDQAIACHKYRARLRHQAQQRGMYKLRAFCGAHLLQGGKYAEVPAEKSFPRRRTGQVCNYHPWARQALFLLGDQFNRRPETPWGQKLLHYKALRRIAHPEPIQNEAGKLRHNDGHIHKTALWKTLTHFVDHIFREWTRIEKAMLSAESADPADRGGIEDAA